jgi:hypothetical protein
LLMEASQALERQEVERRAAAERAGQEAAAQRREQEEAERRRQEAVRRETEQRERQDTARRAEEASRREQERPRVETAAQEADPTPPEPRPAPTEQRWSRKPVGLGAVMGALAAVAAIVLVIVAVSQSGGGGSASPPRAPSIPTRATASQTTMGTWRDERSGLQWTAKDNGSNSDWDSAKSYCDGLTLGGSSDWRMPTIAELENFYDGKQSLTQRGAVTLTNWYVWSRDLKSDDSSAAWLFNFFYGKRNWFYRANYGGNRALCVRRFGG